MSETPAKKDPPKTTKVTGNTTEDDTAFKHVTEVLLGLTPDLTQDLQDALRYHKIPNLHLLTETLLSDDIDKNMDDIKPYKVGNKSYQLTKSITSSLRRLAIWTLDLQYQLNARVTNADWLILTKADYDKWRISTPSLGNRSGAPPPLTPQPFTPSAHGTPSSNMSSNSSVSFQELSNFRKSTKSDATAYETRVTDSLRMALTKDDFEQWCIASNYELPDDSEINSISLNLTEDFDDLNLVSLFELPAGDEVTSIFVDIADNDDNWTLASIFEPPNDDAAILTSSDPHFNAQNHTPGNPPEAYGLSKTSVNLSAQNGEPFYACTIKNDQGTKDIILDIDDSDQISKKAIVAIQNPDEDATKTMIDIENQELAPLPVDTHLPDTNQYPLVDKSLELYHHGENAPTDLSNTKSESPKGHNMANTAMTNQPLLSPLCGKHYNMAQQRLHHVATLKVKVVYDNGPFDTSFTSSCAHLCTTSPAPSDDVTEHFNQDSSPDTHAYHKQAQDSIRSEYFEAFHQLQHLIALKKPVNTTVACQHGETTHVPSSTCVEQPHATKAPHHTSGEQVPNQAFVSAEPNCLANPSSLFLTFDLHAHFCKSILPTPCLLTVPCKVNLDPPLGNYTTFHHTMEPSSTNLADDDPKSSHPKAIFFHSPADDDPTQSLLSTWPPIPFLLDASTTFSPTLWDTTTNAGANLLTCCADPSVGESLLTSFLKDCKSDGTEKSPLTILQVLMNLFLFHSYWDMFKVLFVAHQDQQALLEWETGESTFDYPPTKRVWNPFTILQDETTTANPSMSSLLLPLKILVSPTSSSGTTQSCQDLANFCKIIEHSTTTFHIFKSTAIDTTHVNEIAISVKTYKVHDHTQWTHGNVLIDSPIGYPLFSVMDIFNHIKLRSWGAGIGNMHFPSLAHFHKSDDPNAIQLFDGGPTVLQKMVIDMAKHEIGEPWHETPNQFILLFQEHSSVYQSDIQGQDNYDYFTSQESVVVHSVKPSSQYHNENAVPCYSVTKNDQIQGHKNYGKDHWTTETIIILTYLIIALVAHGHLTKDHSYITIFQAALWGALLVIPSLHYQRLLLLKILNYISSQHTLVS
ncbi:hypothetical protein ACA910_001038 [Epithemia clementina (nom. ined.)]